MVTDEQMIAAVKAHTEVDGKARTAALRAALEAAFAAIPKPEPAALTVPEGWKLVPAVATPEMIKKGVDLAMRVAITGEYRWTDYIADQYRNILSAAPEAPHE